MAGFKRTLLAAALVIAAASGHLALAQVPGAPVPIPTPPIPDPPRLGAQPRISLPRINPPGKPDIEIPDAANLDRVAIPPEAAITPPDKADMTPMPISGRLTPAPPMVSPGASESQIEEVAFIVDPGSSQIPASAQTKLRDVAAALAQNQAARLEIRVFSPSKSHSQSNARRLSLSRFLAIRDFLTNQGVSEARIDGRPLVSEPNELNADRIELYIER